MAKDFTNNLTPEQKDLSSRVFDLLLGRVLKGIYLNLDGKSRRDMEKVFLAENNKEKEAFIKKHKLNFEKLFKAEAKSLEAELESEIEKQS